MAQRIIYALELLVLLGFGWAVIYQWARPTTALKECQRTGCLSGGCLVPLIFLVLAVAADDLGGPLFWPLILILGAMLGTFIGTLYIVFRGSK